MSELIAIIVIAIYTMYTNIRNKNAFQAVFLKRNVTLEENAAKLADIKPDHKVLEVGFGPGVGLKAAHEYIKDGTGEIHGVDLSDKMVNIASHRLSEEIKSGKIYVHKGNVLHLQFENDTFDRAFHCNCYYFWQDLHKGCSELFRVMKPCSKMITTITLDSLQDAKKAGYMKYGKIDHVPYMRTLEEVGFQDVDIYDTNADGKSFQYITANIKSK